MAGQFGVGPDSDAKEHADDEPVSLWRSGVYNFLQVPCNLEPMLSFGFVTCLDCFLAVCLHFCSASAASYRVLCGSL